MKDIIDYGLYTISDTLKNVKRFDDRLMVFLLKLI